MRDGQTALLAGIARIVQAVDFSEAILAKAKEKSAFDNVTFTVAVFTQPWPCEDESANLVTCNLVLEHIAPLQIHFR